MSSVGPKVPKALPNFNVSYVRVTKTQTDLPDSGLLVDEGPNLGAREVGQPPRILMKERDSGNPVRAASWIGGMGHMDGPYADESLGLQRIIPHTDRVVVAMLEILAPGKILSQYVGVSETQLHFRKPWGAFPCVVGLVCGWKVEGLKNILMIMTGSI